MAYQSDRKAIALAEIGREVDAVVSQLASSVGEQAVPVPHHHHDIAAELKSNQSALANTLSFIPGQPQLSLLISFSNPQLASETYKAQAAFGRKIDLRARFACGRCARPFNSYPGGPSLVQSRAARRAVAGKNMEFTIFCREVLGVAHTVVRAEIYFSLLCDLYPPLLHRATVDAFRWSSFVEHATESFDIWRQRLVQLQAAQAVAPLQLEAPHGVDSAARLPSEEFAQGPQPSRKKRIRSSSNTPDRLGDSHQDDDEPSRSKRRKKLKKLGESVSGLDLLLEASGSAAAASPTLQQETMKIEPAAEEKAASSSSAERTDGDDGVKDTRPSQLLPTGGGGSGDGGRGQRWTALDLRHRGGVPLHPLSLDLADHAAFAQCSAFTSRSTSSGPALKFSGEDLGTLDNGTLFVAVSDFLSLEPTLGLFANVAFAEGQVITAFGGGLRSASDLRTLLGADHGKYARIVPDSGMVRDGSLWALQFPREPQLLRAERAKPIEKRTHLMPEVRSLPFTKDDTLGTLL